MKEQYRQEMQKIHVPESLLEKTKLAMKAEEQKIKTQKEEKKIIPFGKVSVLAAAAVLMLVLIPAIAGDEAGMLNHGSMQKEQVYLSAKEDVEIVKIEAEEETGFRAWLEGMIEKIEELFD